MHETTAEEVGRRATEQLLAGDHPYLRTLREQYDRAEVDVDVTRTGFYLDYSVPRDVDLVPVEDRFRFGDVEASTSDLDHGIGFVLVVDDGTLSQLEGYTYEEELPETLDALAFEYAEADRDEAALFPE